MLTCGHFDPPWAATGRWDAVGLKRRMGPATYRPVRSTPITGLPEMVGVTKTSDKVRPATMGPTVPRGIEPGRAIEPNAGLGGGGGSQSDCRDHG